MAGLSIKNAPRPAALTSTFFVSLQCPGRKCECMTRMQSFRSWDKFKWWSSRSHLERFPYIYAISHTHGKLQLISLGRISVGWPGLGILHTLTTMASQVVSRTHNTFRPQFRFPNPICFSLCVVFLFVAMSLPLPLSLPLLLWLSVLLFHTLCISIFPPNTLTQHTHTPYIHKLSLHFPGLARKQNVTMRQQPLKQKAS